MRHQITALILKGSYDLEKVESYDLRAIDLGSQLTMFQIDHYYTACWQAKLGIKDYLDSNGAAHLIYPTEYVLQTIMEAISKEKQPLFSLIATDYFGGYGHQHANTYQNGKLVDSRIKTINEALEYMGVRLKPGMDAFDSVGLSNYRSDPEYLEKYVDLADELGV